MYALNMSFKVAHYGVIIRPTSSRKKLMEQRISFTSRCRMASSLLRPFRCEYLGERGVLIDGFACKDSCHLKPTASTMEGRLVGRKISMMDRQQGETCIPFLKFGLQPC